MFARFQAAAGRLWEKEKAMARRVGGVLRRLWRRMDEDDILFLASGLAFNVLLCLLPILIFWVYVLGLWRQSADSMRVVDHILEAAFPRESNAPVIRERISAVLAGIVAGGRPLGWISLGALAVTATSLFSSIRGVLHRVFRIRSRRHFLVSYLADIGFVLALTLLLLAVTSLVLGYRFARHFQEYLPPLDSVDFHGMLGALPDLVSIPVMAGLCYLLYRFVPAERIGRRPALVAALTTTLIWEVSGRIFAFYLGSLASLNQIYGAYAFVLVIMLWTFYSCVIFVLGAEAGEVWKELRMKKEE